MLKVLVEQRSESKTLKDHIGEILSCTQNDYHLFNKPEPKVPTKFQESIPPPEVYEGPLNQEAYKTIIANKPSLGVHLSTGKGMKSTNFAGA